VTVELCRAAVGVGVPEGTTSALRYAFGVTHLERLEYHPLGLRSILHVVFLSAYQCPDIQQLDVYVLRAHVGHSVSHLHLNLSASCVLAFAMNGVEMLAPIQDPWWIVDREMLRGLRGA